MGLTKQPAFTLTKIKEEVEIQQINLFEPTVGVL